MPDLDFSSILGTLKDEVISLAMSTFKDFKNEAQADALKLVEDMKEKLERWTILLAEGKLTPDDFKFLVLAQKELLEMNALRLLGISKIRLDEFKSKLLKLVIDTVLGLI